MYSRSREARSNSLKTLTPVEEAMGGEANASGFGACSWRGSLVLKNFHITWR